MRKDVLRVESMEALESVFMSFVSAGLGNV